MLAQDFIGHRPTQTQPGPFRSIFRAETEQPHPVKERAGCSGHNAGRDAFRRFLPIIQRIGSLRLCSPETRCSGRAVPASDYCSLLRSGVLGFRNRRLLPTRSIPDAEQIEGRSLCGGNCTHCARLCQPALGVGDARQSPLPRSAQSSRDAPLTLAAFSRRVARIYATIVSLSTMRTSSLPFGKGMERTGLEPVIS